MILGFVRDVDDDVGFETDDDDAADADADGDIVVVVAVCGLCQMDQFIADIYR